MTFSNNPQPTAAPSGSAALPIGFFGGQESMKAPTTALDSMLSRPAPTVETDLVASQPVLDAKNRIGLGKITRTVGLEAGDRVAVAVHGDVVRISKHDAARPAGVAVLQLDAQQRVTLTAGLCFTLGIRRGHQVQAIADPSTGHLTLISLARILAHVVSDVLQTETTNILGATA